MPNTVTGVHHLNSSRFNSVTKNKNKKNLHWMAHGQTLPNGYDQNMGNRSEIQTDCKLNPSPHLKLPSIWFVTPLSLFDLETKTAVLVRLTIRLAQAFCTDQEQSCRKLTHHCTLRTFVIILYNRPQRCGKHSETQTSSEIRNPSE